jgi:hypothetical protein
MKVGWDVCGGATLTELTGWFEGDLGQPEFQKLELCVATVMSYY